MRGVRRAVAVVFVAVVVLGLAAAWLVPLPARLRVPGSSVVRWSDGTAAHVFLAPDGRWRVPVSLDRVDPKYVQALLAYEDRRFWWHPGVDPVAVARAAFQNLSAGHVVSGASTITMQLVRLTEPRPRTFRSKLIEALRAMQLEARFSKRKILETYISFTSYGRNIEGVEAASLAYFGHSADALTPGEIAVLLAVPQDPNARYPAPEHEAALRAARDHVVETLGDALPTDGRLVAEVRAEIEAAPVPTRLRPMPREAPHAARWAAERLGLAPGALLDTTLDRGVQHTVERIVAELRPWANRRGIYNIAVVVLDWRTGQVRGLVGGFDFFDERHGGQIPAFAEPRSPGSTLKPYVYAMAIDRGLVLPATLVRDVPIRFSGYAPQNYDGHYDGLVPLQDALSRSLNVPFVELLSRLGVEPFLGTLRSMGVTHLVDRPGWYGLSLVAGGIELTPMELAGLFSTLARGGVWIPETLRASDSARPVLRRRIFSEGAAYLTRRALSLKDRPDFPARLELTATPRNVHWKTGTSFGNRDAWAIGSGGRYTVAVWLGNLDNSSSPWLVGAKAAAPVLFDIVDALHDSAPPLGKPPSDLVQVEVCALSGRLPNAACPHIRKVLALVSHVPTERCRYHVQALVDTKTGQRVRPGCRRGHKTETRSFVTWPASVRRYYRGALADLPELPPWAPDCAVQAVGGAPQIRSISPGQVALLIPGLPAVSQAIPLVADARAATELSWFVDGVLTARVPADEPAWWTPVPGRHEVLVMDRAGRTDKVWFTVRGG